MLLSNIEPSHAVQNLDHERCPKAECEDLKRREAVLESSAKRLHDRAVIARQCGYLKVAKQLEDGANADMSKAIMLKLQRLEIMEKSDIRLVAVDGIRVA